MADVRSFVRHRIVDADYCANGRKPAVEVPVTGVMYAGSRKSTEEVPVAGITFGAINRKPTVEVPVAGIVCAP